MEDTLGRFRRAHDDDYETALREIRAGRKESHWMWYIFPQLEGLGHSAEAEYYAIRGREEAAAYWNDPVLSDHLTEICEALLELDAPIRWILGYPDYHKLRSCMTLFWLVTGEGIFMEVLERFLDGVLDAYTVEKLNT